MLQHYSVVQREYMFCEWMLKDAAEFQKLCRCNRGGERRRRRRQTENYSGALHARALDECDIHEYPANVLRLEYLEIRPTVMRVSNIRYLKSTGGGSTWKTERGRAEILLHGNEKRVRIKLSTGFSQHG